MNISISTKAITDCLSKTQGIFSKSSKDTIYVYVLLETIGKSGKIETKEDLPAETNDEQEDALKVTVSDSHMTIVLTTTGVRIKEHGSICIKGKKLLEILRSINSESVDFIKGDNRTLKIHAGKAKFTIKETREISAFPQIKLLSEQDNGISITSQNIKRMIDETIFSISDDSNRPGLSGANIELTNNDQGYEVVRVVSTDGNRLSLSEAEYLVGNRSNLSTHKKLLPKGALHELKKLCGNNDDEEWKIIFGDKEVCFSNENSSFQFFLLDGDFPEYERVFETLKLKNEFIVDRKILLSVFRRVSAVVENKEASVTFRVGGDLSDSQMEITTKDQELADFKEIISIEYEGEALEVAFRISYLYDVINATNCDALRVKLGSNLDPCLVQNTSKSTAKFIVMPMRVNT